LTTENAVPEEKAASRHRVQPAGRSMSWALQSCCFTLLALAIYVSAAARTPPTPLPVAPEQITDTAEHRTIDRRLDEYIQTEMRKSKIVGLSLAIVRNGHLVKAKGYGFANIETRTPATPETIYKIGSISKQFLASGIMLLVADGKVSLDDPITKYLNAAPQSWEKITVRELLTHTSGLAAQRPENDPPGYEPFKIQPDADLIRRNYSIPLEFAPGTKWRYSNLGYFVIAEIITRASGVPWNEYLSAMIFAPAGMAATRVTSTTDIVPNRADGYVLEDGRLQKAESWIAVRPSGAFLSNVLDMAKWDAVLYSDRVLTASMRERMWTPANLADGTTYPYGFGWSLDSWHGHRRIDHNGGIPGFLSDFERFVDDELAVIVLMNTSSGNPTQIALDVADLYSGQPTSVQ
jgi:D-alanyl-D-alanine carboxypeptidase